MFFSVLIDQPSYTRLYYAHSKWLPASLITEPDDAQLGLLVCWSCTSNQVKQPRWFHASNLTLCIYICVCVYTAHNRLPDKSLIQVTNAICTDDKLCCSVMPSIQHLLYWRNRLLKLGPRMNAWLQLHCQQPRFILPLKLLKSTCKCLQLEHIRHGLALFLQTRKPVDTAYKLHFLQEMQ